MKAIDRLLHSKKFLSWRPKIVSRKARSTYFSSEVVHRNGSVSEHVYSRHFSPTELAKVWGVSVETVRSIFRDEPGVLKIGKTGAKYRRGYVTLRIPREVAERVHRKLSA